MIERKALVALAARDNDVAHQLWSLTSRELRRVQNHVLLLIQRAQERVAGFLLEMADRVLTIETVSRTLTHLERRGAITLPTSRRVVHCRSALNQINAESGWQLRGTTGQACYQ
jgi:CRP/FNR family nitrogen fixation transcriptional regulator